MVPWQSISRVEKDRTKDVMLDELNRLFVETTINGTRSVLDGTITVDQLRDLLTLVEQVGICVKNGEFEHGVQGSH